MDITTIVINGLMGGLAAMVLYFTCELLATLMQGKEQACVISKKGRKQ